MKFKLYREYGSLNSKPVFDAFEKGLQNLGYSTTAKDNGVPVIWSVLWHGRMAKNQAVFRQAMQEGKHVLILEVGNLVRGTTWRLSLNNINGEGIFGNNLDLDEHRPQHLNVSLNPIKKNRQQHILIACQHQRSHQWQNNPSMQQWVINQITEIRKYSNRPIVIRPHPRSKFTDSFKKFSNITLDMPKPVPNTYDSFNINYNCHCVVNFNSGPAVQSAIHGTPVICDRSNLAFPVSDKIEHIHEPVLPDRTDWFIKLCHTEWTLSELSSGEPLKRLLQFL